VIAASPELIQEARDWMNDCVWKEDPEELEELSDQEVLVSVHRYYDGGLAQLARNCFLDEPEGIPT
jgi:hypothetical protein